LELVFSGRPVSTSPHAGTRYISSLVFFRHIWKIGSTRHRPAAGRRQVALPRRGRCGRTAWPGSHLGRNHGGGPDGPELRQPRVPVPRSRGQPVVLRHLLAEGGVGFEVACRPEPGDCRNRMMNMTYVDGFVRAVPTANRDACRRHAERAALVFNEHGARSLLECWGEVCPRGGSRRCTPQRSADEMSAPPIVGH
jgi:hypothetical protein